MITPSASPQDWEASQGRFRMSAGMIIAFVIFFLLLLHCCFRFCHHYCQGRQQQECIVENRRTKILDNISQMSIPYKIEAKDEEVQIEFHDSSIEDEYKNSLEMGVKSNGKKQSDGTSISNIIVQTMIQERARRMENPNPNCEVDQVLCNQKECSICSDEYKSGDKIAWSRNEQCFHLFHIECIVPWLMNHSDCPMCRNDFLCFQNEA